MKACFKCGQEKPRSAFYAHHAMGDGLLGKCKDCTRKDSTARRNANLAQVRAYDRQRSSLPHRVAQRKRVQARWRALHPSRRAAQIALGNALRRGSIKPLPCFICGEKAEAHHPDYSAPLDVVWLCSPHHKQAHAMAKAA